MCSAVWHVGSPLGSVAGVVAARVSSVSTRRSTRSSAGSARPERLSWRPRSSSRSLERAARAVRPAPAFRAFLTVDQHYGDVSRAMRNRCCHVCVAAAPPPASDPLDVDQGAGSWRAGVLDPASQRARDDADFVAGGAPAEAAARGRIVELRLRAATGEAIDGGLALRDLVVDGHAIDDAHERLHYKADTAFALEDLLASPDVTECGGRVVRESDVAEAWGDARRAGASARRRRARAPWPRRPASRRAR